VDSTATQTGSLTTDTPGALQPSKLLRWDADVSVVIIASGPSLTREDAGFCRGKARVIVINDTWRMAPWADVLYAYHAQWWNYHSGVSGFDGHKWTSVPFEDDFKLSGDVPLQEAAICRWGLDWIRGKMAAGMSFDEGLIHFGGNGGFQALNLAVLFGAKKIILLGYDMQESDGKSHWHEDHPATIRRNMTFGLWRDKLGEAASGLLDRGISVINCTRRSALNCFPRAILQDVI
jgi:hypothetical protein